MSEFSTALRARVNERAAGRCEYCGLSQEGQEATFHIDHVTPRSLGGDSNEDNLALACVSCSLRKGAKNVGTDPESGAEFPLFDPRTSRWSDHFRWDGVYVVPITAIGRVTLATLAMNRALIVAIRNEEAIRGRHPP